MIFTPDVLVIRSDDQDGNWHAPITVDVVTLPRAVNNGVVMRDTKKGEEEEAKVKVRGGDARAYGADFVPV